MAKSLIVTFLFHPPYLVNTIQYLIYKLQRRHQASFHLSLALTAGCCNPSLLGPKIVSATCLKGVVILTLSPWQWQVWLCSFRQAMDKEVIGLTCVIHLKPQQDLSLSSSIAPKDLELFSVLGLMDKILGAWGMKCRGSITMWEGMWSEHLINVPQHLKHISHQQGCAHVGWSMQVMVLMAVIVADDFSYIALEQAKRKKGELSVHTFKHNAETSHAQHLKQQQRILLTFVTFMQGN